MNDNGWLTNLVNGHLSKMPDSEFTSIRKHIAECSTKIDEEFKEMYELNGSKDFAPTLDSLKDNPTLCEQILFAKECIVNSMANIGNTVVEVVGNEERRRLTAPQALEIMDFYSGCSTFYEEVRPFEMSTFIEGLVDEHDDLERLLLTDLAVQVRAEDVQEFARGFKEKNNPRWSDAMKIDIMRSILDDKDQPSVKVFFDNEL